MKKLWFFLFSVMTLSSCVDYPGIDEPKVTSDYTVKVNGAKTFNNDTVYVSLNEITLFEMLDTKGNKVEAVFRSSNLSSAFGTGTMVDISYSTIGVYRITASPIGGNKTVTIYVSVQKSTNYSLKINGVTVANGSTFKASTTQSLKVKVVDPDNKAVTTTFDFGNNSKIKADSTTYYYSSAGTYTFRATTGNKVITLSMVITKGASEAVILISSSISGTTINAALGFRVNAIPNFSSAKATYVVGEIPNVPWKKYDVSEVVNIGGVDYFKWNVNVPAGKFRLSWIQQKDPSVTFNYDLCNWSYDPTSNFWNVSDYLYYFYLRIENNSVVLSAS